MSGKNNQKKANVWDHRPISDQGGERMDGLFLSVGFALSRWEWLQSTLIMLFCGLVRCDAVELIRAMGTQMNVISKLDMLREIIEHFECDEVVRASLIKLMNDVG